jgi:hypothetical protein
MAPVTIPRLLSLAALALWLLVVGAGFERVWRYSATPGPAASALPEWPSTVLARDAQRPTLVMFLHPECGCSQASLEELSRLVNATRSQAAVLVVIGSPVTGSATTSSNALWRTAATIPGATTILDRGGVEAAKFGAHVSGQTFLYDRAGRLEFDGGITSARGQAGDNDGEASLRALLARGRSPLRRTSVFGCLLEGTVRS